MLRMCKSCQNGNLTFDSQRTVCVCIHKVSEWVAFCSGFPAAKEAVQLIWCICVFWGFFLSLVYSLNISLSVAMLSMTAAITKLMGHWYTAMEQ